MPDKKDPEIRPDNYKVDNMPDEKQRKLAREGGKIASGEHIDEVSNTGGTGDNRGGEVLDKHLPVKDHDQKIKAIPSDKIVAHEPGNNEDDLSNRAKEDRSSR